MTDTEWEPLNRRRAALIRLDLAGVLTALERVELDWLQRESLARVEHLYPPTEMSITTKRTSNMTRDELQTQTLKG